MKNALQILSSLVALAVLLCMVKRARRSGRWFSSVPAAGWLLHLLAFYAYVFGYRGGLWPPSGNVTTWSSALTFHAAIVQAMYLWYSLSKHGD